MATAFSKQSDCPSCQSLCLSPTILPCGHLMCRKCVRHTFQDKGHNPACPFCSYSIPKAQGQTISQWTDQLGKDLILEDLVMEQLAGQGQVFCEVCPNKVAIKMCVDCGEMYCEPCSVSHKRMKATKDHVQQDLPQTLSNTSTSARFTDRPQRHHISTSSDVISSSPDIISSSPEVMSSSLEIMSSSPSQEIISFLPSRDSTGYDHDTRPGPRQNTHQASLQEEARLFRQKILQLGKSVSVVRANMAQLQEVERRLEGQQQLLETYTARLENADQALVASARTLLPRLKRVRQDCRPPPEAALTSLTRHVNSLMQSGTDTDGILFDPETSVPSRTFIFAPETAGDTHKEGPMVHSLVIAGNGRLVMADWRNDMVKVAEINTLATTVQAVTPLEHAVTSNVASIGGCMRKWVKLDTRPLRLALLRDGQVAVTGSRKRIYFLDVAGTPIVASQVPTKRQYYGVGSLTDDDTLLAGCHKDEDGPSSVDVLTRAGVVLKSVIDSSSLAALSCPSYLYVQNRTVWVTDIEANAVYKVDIDTGCAITTFSHTDLNNPMQVAVDKANNCYIASGGSKCVLVVTSAGQWHRLLNGSEHGEVTRVYPGGLCVTDWGVVVTWDGLKEDFSGPGSVVSGYQLT